MLGGALSYYKVMLIKFQKNIVRVSASFNTHTPPIFKKTDSKFVQNKNIHNYGTRHAELYCNPLTRINLMRNSLRCTGVIFWNTCVVLSHCNCTLNGFK